MKYNIFAKIVQEKSAGVCNKIILMIIGGGKGRGDLNVLKLWGDVGGG